MKWKTNFNLTDETEKSEQMYDEAECLSRLMNILSKMGADSLKFHLIAHDYKVTLFSMAGQMAYPVLVGRLSGKNSNLTRYLNRIKNFRGIILLENKFYGRHSK